MDPLLGELLGNRDGTLVCHLLQDLDIKVQTQAREINLFKLKRNNFEFVFNVCDSKCKLYCPVLKMSPLATFHRVPDS